jgi:ribosome-associated heat shock protein Hsp15
MSQGEALRIDKWLWHARFARTREMAGELIARRRVRLNNQVVAKAHALVRLGDVITLTQPARVRVLRVLALGARRGPPSDAQHLFEELVESG